MPESNKTTAGIPGLDSSVEYRTLKSKEAELHAALDAAKQKHAAAMEAARQSHMNGIVEKKRRVAELLGDPMPELTVERGDIAAINLDISDIKVALDEVRQRLCVARNKASKTICDQVRPTYLSLVRAICDALINANRANTAYCALVNELSNKDIAWSQLIPMRPVHLLGNPNDTDGKVARYLREAAEIGAIDEADIPDALWRGKRTKSISPLKALTNKLAVGANKS